MSNLGSIPQIPAGTTFSLVSNAAWLDQFYVQQPGYSSTPAQVFGTVTDGSPTITLNTVNGITTGGLVVGFGVVPGSQILSVVDSTLNQITLNQNCVVPPTGQATPTVATYVPLSVFGPALDLTGVTFQSTVRQSLTSFTNLLLATTGNGLMINGGANGTFGWNVPSGEPNWPIGLTQVGGLAAVVDVQASDISGSIVDLTTLSGPIPLIVTLGPVATTLLGSTMVRINSQ